jgi:peptide/nickel transport system permease protein
LVASRVAVVQGVAPSLPTVRRRPTVAMRIWHDRKGRAGLMMLVVLVLLIVVGPLLLAADPNTQDLRARLAPPLGSARATLAHPMGTDQLGRDLLARILVGGQLSLFIGLVASLIAAFVGVAAGLVAGYAGGRWDGLITAVADVQLTFPSIMFALAVMVVLGTGIFNLIAVLAISSWVFQSRIIRAEVLSLKHRDFVLAGRALGARDTHLLLRHILPNVMGSVLVLFTLTVVRTILSEASLSFLGLGIQPPSPSWGGMLSEGRQYLASAWWVGTIPGVVLMFAIVSINLVGDSLRDILDPRIQQQGS